MQFPRVQAPYWGEIELKLLRELEAALKKKDEDRESEIRCALRVMRELYDKPVR